MASRLLTLEATRGTVLVRCACGFRVVTGTREAARVEADRHRAADHPRQATYVQSKRRIRDRVTA